MDQNASHVKVEDIEASLDEVGEIKASRVVVSPEGVIQEVHVLALPTKQPKQLVRDIESTLMARFGISIDHKKISIALLGRDAVKAEATPVSVERAVAKRPQICSVSTTVSGVQASASVTLEIGGAEFTGSASGAASQSGRSRLIALATLDAIGRHADTNVSYAVEDIEILKLGHEKVAVSCVSMVGSFGQQTLSGSAVVRQDNDDSVVRATLDAVNRRMGHLTTA